MEGVPQGDRLREGVKLEKGNIEVGLQCEPWRLLCFPGVGASGPGVYLTLGDLPHPSPAKLI